MTTETEPDKYCVSTPDGDCISDDPRCMHMAPKLIDPAPNRRYDDVYEAGVEWLNGRQGAENRIATEKTYTCLVVERRFREIQVCALSAADADEKATAAAAALDYSDVEPAYECDGVVLDPVPK